MRDVSAMALVALAAACAAACGELREDDGFSGEAAQVGDVMDAALGERPADAGVEAADAGASGAGPCSDLFDQTRLHTFEVQISDAEMQKLNDEFLRPQPDSDNSGLRHPWHPITFKLGSESRSNAMIRLKGDSSWLEAVRLDRNPKAQFVIAFDRIDKKATFHGLSKIELDMPRSDPTFLRERMGHHIMRDLGLGGVCSVSVRLHINGRYYGLYAAQEDMGKELLRRLYPGAAKGALWKSGDELETDETPEVLARQEAWTKATDIPAMQKVLDLEQAIDEWAAEIALNNSDGYYGGVHNFYTYDHPVRGFQWIPTDLDSTFDYLEATIHPVYWWEQHDTDQTAGHHFRAVINDPVWRAKLVDAVERVVARWDVPKYQARVDAWAKQIATSVQEDPRRPMTMARVNESTGWLRDTVLERPAFLKTWIACERTGRGTDADRDGVPWCKDCNDRSALQRPGARETCLNGRDEDCDGLRDEGCVGGPPDTGGAPPVGRRPRWPWTPRDAGVPRDAGALPRDAGALPRDAGALPRDAGAPLADAGGTPVTPRDAGMTGPAPRADAGTGTVAPRDAGVPRTPVFPRDAGAARDAGTDAGRRGLFPRWPGLGN